MDCTKINSNLKMDSTIVVFFALKTYPGSVLVLWSDQMAYYSYLRYMDCTKINSNLKMDFTIAFYDPENLPDVNLDSLE